MTKRHPFQVEWRIKPLMKDRGIRTVLQLRQRLEDEYGLMISQSQLYSVVRSRPARIRTDLLAALILLLDCPHEELFHVRREKNSEIGTLS